MLLVDQVKIINPVPGDSPAADAPLSQYLLATGGGGKCFLSLMINQTKKVPMKQLLLKMCLVLQSYTHLQRRKRNIGREVQAPIELNGACFRIDMHKIMLLD